MTAQPAPSAAVTERLAEVLAAHDDVWYDASQPPGDRDFGCICGPTPLGHVPEDDEDAVLYAHIAAVLAPLVAEYAEARVAEAWDEALRAAADLAETYATSAAAATGIRFTADRIRAVLPDPADTGGGL